VAEVPIVFADRRVGKSKMSRRIVLEAIRKVWSIRSSPFARKARAEARQKASRAA
jgi:dolichol-phosphate mannosyltransferase